MANNGRTFTTYINVEEDKRVSQNLAAYERKAKNTLQRIQQAAGAAAGTGMLGGTSRGGGVQQVNALANAERRHADALSRVISEQNRAAITGIRTSSAFREQGRAVDQATAKVSRFERAMRLASQTATIAQGPLGPIAGRLNAIGSAASQLSGIPLGLVGVGAGVATFARFASQVQDLKSKLAPLYDSQEKVNAAWRDSVRIANDARQALEPVVDLYTRLTIGGRQQGLSASEISKMTELASKAARLSGGTAVSQEAGLYQFAQGIGSGNLQGDELRSVRENTLRLAKALSDGLDVPIGKLKEMGAEGELTARRIYEALVKSEADINREMERLPATLSQGMSLLKTNFADFINSTESATGMVGALSEALIFLAKNLDTTLNVALLLGTAFVSYKASGVVQNIAQQTAQWVLNRGAMKDNAREAMKTAAAQRNVFRQRLTDLRMERVALQAQLALDRQARAEAVARASAMRRAAATSGDTWTGAQWREYRTAIDAARTANTNFMATQTALSRNFSAMRAQVAAMSGTTAAYRRAIISARAASAGFGAALLNAAKSVNIVGIAVSIAIPLIISLAMKQDEAAAAADRMASRQEQLANVLDFGTRKIKEQTGALQELILMQLRADLAKESQATKAAREAFREGGETRMRFDPVLGGYYQDTKDPEIQRIINAYNPSDPNNNIYKTMERLGELSRTGTSRQRGEAERYMGVGATLMKSTESLGQAKSAQNILSGKGTAEDWRRVQGNFTGEDVDLAEGMATAEGDVADARTRRAAATDEAAKAERELQKAQNLADKRADIMSRYDEAPKLVDTARKDMRELQQMVGKTIELRDALGNALTTINEAGDEIAQTGIYTQAMADADKARIEYGLGKPFRDAIKEQDRLRELAVMRLDGYDLEAAALEKALDLQERGRAVSEEEFELLVRNERQQLRINDALESRNRISSLILDSANQTRDAFEEMLVSLGTGGNAGDALKQFGKQMLTNVMRIEARKLTEQIFAGTDQKLRDLIDGGNGVERAVEILKGNVEDSAAAITPLITAQEKLTAATEYTADRMRAIGDGLVSGGGGVSGLAPADGVSSAISKARAGASSVGSIIQQASALARSASFISVVSAVAASAVRTGVPGLASSEGGDIVVEANRYPSSNIKTSGASVYNQMLGADGLGGGLDQIFGTNIFGKIGGYAGTALGGAGNGMMVSGLMGMLGLPTSSTGAAIGGAIGSFLPIPGGSFIGGGIGSLIGGIINGPAKGSVNIGGTGDQFSITKGYSSNAQNYANAQSAGGAVTDLISQIAQATGATLNMGVGRVSIGQRGEDWRVDPTGSGQTKAPFVLNFGTDQEAAIAAAVRNLIQDGVLTGISQASINILSKSGDLQKAIEKAAAIESIPKQLAAIKDPARAAIDELNVEFTKLISYLKEGGATAEQYAQAEELYNLKRKEIMEQITNTSIDAIQSYLDDIRGGSSSPFNAITTYNNAKDVWAKLQADVQAGKTVDSNDLLQAARNFQDASQQLNGSSTSFFSDFSTIQSVLEKAITNASTGNGTGGLSDIPSPFNDAYVQSMIAATNNQTDILAGKLDQLIAANGGTPQSNTNGQSAMNYLPDYNAYAYYY